MPANSNLKILQITILKSKLNFLIEISKSQFIISLIAYFIYLTIFILKEEDCTFKDIFEKFLIQANISLKLI